MTKSKEIANNIKDYYKEKGNNCYVREKRVVNEDFISILNEYDKLLSSVSIEDIINIEKIILSNYKEMVIENYEN